MRNTNVLLGLIVILLLGGAYFLFVERAVAPGTEEEMINSENSMSLSLTSKTFVPGEMIPAKYTCDGENINPPLAITGVPDGTKSLVLVMDDPDIPKEIKETRGIEKFDHWVLYNLPPDTTEIPSGVMVGSAGINSAGQGAYTGPCPPTEYEPYTHRYIFRLYAISGTLNFIKTPTLDEVEEAAKGMVLEQAELTGVYTRR